jgi:putative flippase GtrA
MSRFSDLRAMASGPTGVQFLRFVVIGAGSTVLDFLVYMGLLHLIDLRLAKACGYIAGTAFSIGVNYRWNFAYQGPDGLKVIAKCCLLYLLALGLNVAVNHAALTVLGRTPVTLGAAFVLAVGACTVFNFAGMKLWIFRRPRFAA